MDPINLILFGIVIAAIVLLYRWNAEAPKVQSTLNEETRRQAKPLIPLPIEGADADLFQLQQTPMLVRPTDKLRAKIADPQVSSFDSTIRDALWTPQRQMLLRLESELEMAQQAEVSDHFAIAGPANQPAQLLIRTINDAETAFARFCKAIELGEPQRLWYGRAMVLLMSNRKLFDHVAWLTQAGLGTTASGAYFLAPEGVALIPVYGTRIGGFSGTLSQQIARTMLWCLGGKFAALPRWLEEGLLQWLQPPAPQPAVPATMPPAPGSPAPAPAPPPAPEPDPNAILDAAAWQNAQDDPALHQSLVGLSRRAVEWLLIQHRPAFLALLRSGELSQNADEALVKAVGMDQAGIVRAALPATPNATAAFPSSGTA